MKPAFEIPPMPLTRYVLAALLAAGPAASAPALTGFSGHNVVAVMFAPGADDPRFGRQTSELAKLTAQPAFQAVIVVGVADGTVMGASDTAGALRAKFGVGPKDFRFLLLGKDGRTALNQSSVVTSDRIGQAINATAAR